MGLFHTEENSNYRYGIWKIEEDESELELLSGCLAPARITNSLRRLEYLAVRALSKKMGVDPAGILYHTSGKPYHENGEFRISISHTKKYVAFMVSNLELAAIDIETKSERILKIRKKFMSLTEENNLSDSGYDIVTGLLLHWCAKESMFKAVNYEGIDFIEEFQILDFSKGCHPSKGGMASLSGGREDLVLRDAIPPKEGWHPLREEVTLNKGTFKAVALRDGSIFEIDYLIDQDFVFTCCFSK